MKYAISHCDGVIVSDESVNPILTKFAKSLKKPIVEEFGTEDHAEICSNFYDEVLLGEQVAEMAD